MAEAMNAPGLPRFENEAFRRLAASLGPVLAASTPRSFDLLFEEADLPVTLTMHPNGREAAVDIRCRDISQLRGARRRAVVNALLMVNGAARAGPPLCVGLDDDGMVLLHARLALDRLDHGIVTVWINWLLPQARSVRELVRVLSFETVHAGPSESAEGASEVL